MCESRGGRPGLLVPNSPHGLCGRRATLNFEDDTAEIDGAKGKVYIFKLATRELPSLVTSGFPSLRSKRRALISAGGSSSSIRNIARFIWNWQVQT